MLKHSKLPRFRELAQLFFDALVHIAGCKIRRHADGVLDGVGVRPAVANDAYAFHAQQRRAADIRNNPGAS